MARCPFPRRAIHLDCHTLPGIHDAGKEFDAEAFAATLQAAHVEYITVFARCNLGFAYYPTRVGIPYPGLKADLLGGMVKACHKRGIAVAAYFNAGLDHEHAQLHRDWVKLNKDGQVYEMRKDAAPRGSFFRKMCLNTPYGRHLLDMAGEVLDRYPVDGLFFDCFTMSPCYGEECLQGMKTAGLDFRDEAQAKAYTWQVTEAFTRSVQAEIRKRRRDIYLYFNGLPYAFEPTHCELEILPTGGWGYDLLPAFVRYARTLKKPLFMMTGRFHKSWGDFGGLRPEASLQFDCFNAIANGATCSVGDHLHPRGRLDPRVYERIGRVFARTRALDPWADGAAAQAEVAVLSPKTSGWPAGPKSMDEATAFGLYGAARMLMELKVQFDVVDGIRDLSAYRVLVLPDAVALDQALAGRVRQHLARGGSLISSGSSGLDPEGKAFALREWGLACDGPESWTPMFLRADRAVQRGVSDRVITIYQPGLAVRPLKGTRVLARLVQPYFNKGAWDGRHEYVYVPPDRDAGRPALARRGNVFHFSFPVFGGYFNDGVVEFKYLVRNCLDQVLPDPMVKAGALPSYAQVTVTGQGRRRRMVHVLSYVPEMRGRKQIIEEPIGLRDAAVALRRDTLPRVRRVYLVPSKAELPFREADGYVHVTVPAVDGYQMVVFEA